MPGIASRVTKLMNAARVFVDTNVLLYSVDLRDPAKRTRSNAWLDALWQSNSGRLSWHVLHEFYVNAVRKLAVPSEAARESVTLFSLWRPSDTSLGLIERAWYWMDLAALSYWDSMILASAERLGCDLLLSEDFQPGRRYDSVTVVNPFETEPDEFGLTAGSN